MTPATARDRDGRLPIHQAAVYGNLSDVKQMVKEGQDVSAADKKGLTPLHMASQQGHADVARFLLDAGADPNARDAWGNGALMKAVFAYRGDGALINLLLEHGADPDSKSISGKSPREMAITFNKAGLPELFGK